MTARSLFSLKVVHEANQALINSGSRRFNCQLPGELAAIVTPYQKTREELRAAFEQATRRCEQDR